MSDDRQKGLPPFFPMVEDGSAMIINFASRSRAQMLSATGISSTGAIVGTPTLVEAAAIPSLLLQTVIVRGGRTSEGTLIEAVALPWFDIIAFLKTDPSIAFQLPPEKWEEIIAGAYKKAGFEERSRPVAAIMDAMS